MNNAFVSIYLAKFRTLLQYRSAAIAGCGTQLFWGLIRMMIFEGFFRSTSKPQPMSQEETTTYIWLGQAMLLLLPWNVSPDVRASVRDGSVAYELLRPIDLYFSWYARDISQRTAPVLLRAVPIFVIAGVFGVLKPPPTFASGFCWFVATLGAVALSSAFSNLTSIILVHTVSPDGVIRLIPMVVYFGSGMLIPLSLCPQWLQEIFNFLPFRGMMDSPFRLYSGSIPPNDFWMVLLNQVVWTGVLIFVGKWFLNRSMNRMVIQGG